MDENSWKIKQSERNLLNIMRNLQWKKKKISWYFPHIYFNNNFFLITPPSRLEWIFYIENYYHDRFFFCCSSCPHQHTIKCNIAHLYTHVLDNLLKIKKKKKINKKADSLCIRRQCNRKEVHGSEYLRKSIFACICVCVFVCTWRIAEQENVSFHSVNWHQCFMILIHKFMIVHACFLFSGFSLEILFVAGGKEAVRLKREELRVVYWWRPLKSLDLHL